jgi:tetratricopeptide (TPR) repeat protein
MTADPLDPQAALRAEFDALFERGLGLSGAQPQAVEAIAEQMEALLQRPAWPEPYLKGQAGTALLRGLTSLHRLDYLAAFAHTAQAMQLYHQLDDAIGLTRAYYWRGVLNRRTYNLSQALDDMLQAQQQAQRIDNYKLTCNVLNGLASIYMTFKDYSNAISTLEEGIALARQHADAWIEIVTMSNTAYQYIEAGQVERGLDYARQSAEYFLAHQAEVMAIWSLTNVALALRRLGSTQEALQALHQAHELALNTGSEEKRVTVLLALGEVHQESGQLELALAYLEQALALESSASDQMLIVDGYKRLAECHRALGHHERAYDVMTTYYERRIKAYNVEAEGKMALLQARMEAENAQRLAQSERQRAEALARLREQDQQRFEDLESLRLDLLRTIVHDVRSPLSTIGLALDILRQRLAMLEHPPQPEEYHALERQLELIGRANQAITHLINKTLTAARQRLA